MAGKAKLTAAQRAMLERASEQSLYIQGRYEDATAFKLERMGLLCIATNCNADYHITEDGLAALSQQTGSGETGE